MLKYWCEYGPNYTYVLCYVPRVVFAATALYTFFNEQVLPLSCRWYLLSLGNGAEG